MSSHSLAAQWKKLSAVVWTGLSGFLKRSHPKAVWPLAGMVQWEGRDECPFCRAWLVPVEADH